MLMAVRRGRGKGAPLRIASRMGRYSSFSIKARSYCSSWSVSRQPSFRYSRKESQVALSAISDRISIDKHILKEKTEGKSLNPKMARITCPHGIRAFLGFYQTVHRPVTCKTMVDGRAGSAAGAQCVSLCFFPYLLALRRGGSGGPVRSWDRQVVQYFEYYTKYAIFCQFSS